MADREKVLYELKHQVADADWCDNDWKDNVPIWMLRGALALLKEQEAARFEDCFGDYQCSVCKTVMQSEIRYMMDGDIQFCPHCGRKVEWDD